MSNRYPGLHDCPTHNPTLLHSRYEYTLLVLNTPTNAILCQLLPLLHPEANTESAYISDETPFEAFFGDGDTPAEHAYRKNLISHEHALPPWVFITNQRLVDQFGVSLYELNREHTTICEYVWAVLYAQNPTPQHLHHPHPLH